MIKIDRFVGNPVLLPQKDAVWEAESAFNGCVIADNDTYHMVYRAQSLPQIVAGQTVELSTVGHATSSDRVHFSKRSQLITPDQPWEKFGCEDPRVTKIGNTFYIFYTALSHFPPTPEGIKIGLAITDDLQTIKVKHQVTPFNSKAMALFPEKINGKLAAVLTANTDLPPSKICLALFDKEEQIWQPSYWNDWYENLDHHTLALLRNNHDHLEVGAPPLKTESGWLLIYCYIKNYLSAHKSFGIEAVLLDSKNPLKIIGRTEEPLLTPEKNYEQAGKVPNVIFPSGALIHQNTLGIYYGAADTTCCLATCNLDELLDLLRPKKPKLTFDHDKVALRRFSGNPIIAPIVKHQWEDKYTFNTAAVYLNNRVHLLYRAMGKYDTSVLGYAASSDGVHIDERLPNPVYMPREEFERKIQSGHSGCEDPRLTLLDDKLYMCYTAYDGINPTRVALTSITTEDFLQKNWKWTPPKLISPPGMNDKNTCLFPEKVDNKFVFLHRLHHCIWIDFVDSLEFGKDKWLGGHIIMRPQSDTLYSEKVGIAGPPLKTELGWLLIFHGLSKEDYKYRLGAALLDINKPALVKAILPYPILKPDAKYEFTGLRPGTVFSCGAVILNADLFVYYGAADQVVSVASIELEKVLAELKRVSEETSG